MQAQASSSGQKAEASSGLEAEAAAVLTSGSPGIFRAGKGHAAGTVKLAKGHTTSGVCKVRAEPDIFAKGLLRHWSVRVAGCGFLKKASLRKTSFCQTVFT